MARLSVFIEAHPIGADVAGIPHGNTQPIRGLSQGIHHLEGCRFLALQPIGVHRIHQGDRVLICNIANNGEGGIEVALDGNHFGSIKQGLGQFPLGHVAIGNQHKGAHAAPPGVGGRGS